MIYKSTFDNDWIDWSKRKNKQYGGTKAKILTGQKFKCGAYNLKFTIDDQIKLQNIDGNYKNNLAKNLLVLHRSCHEHQPIHGLKRR